MTARIARDETVWNGHVGLHRLTIEQTKPDGTPETLIREVATSPASAVILLRRGADGPIILTRQFRAPALFNEEPAMLIECCAGNIDESSSTAADAVLAAERTARREAEEETGWRVDTVRHLFSLYMSPGVSNERVHFLLGTCTERTGAGGGLAEEGETIETLEVALEEAWTMALGGRIRDAKTVLLVQHLLLEQAGLDRGGAR